MNTVEQPVGSKENPVRLYQFELDELRDILWRAERDYDEASSVVAKTTIREEARKRIFARWPMLFDYAHVALRSDPHAHAYYANEFIKRAFNPKGALRRTEVYG
jgi:hypothetical protein